MPEDAHWRLVRFLKAPRQLTPIDVNLKYGSSDLIAVNNCLMGKDSFQYGAI